MKKKIVFMIAIFVAIIFAMLFIPNSSYATTDITNLNITNPNVPRVGQNPSVTGTDGQAYVNNEELPYGTIVVNSAKWQAKSLSDSSYDDIYDSHTYNSEGTSYRLVIDVSVNGEYRLTNTTIAKANNFGGFTDELGNAEIENISSDGKTARIICTYYLIFSHYSSENKVGFSLTDASGYFAFVLPGTNLELNAHCVAHNYIPSNPYYVKYIYNSTSPTTALTKVTDTKYSFVMPEMNIHIFTDHQRVNTGIVRWGESELIDLGTGYYKLRDDNQMILTTDGATSSNYDIYFDEDNMVMTLNNIEYSGTGWPLELSSKQKYMIAIYSKQVDLTIKIKGNVELNLSHPETNYEIIPIVANGGSLTIENADNTDSELTICDLLNKHTSNYGILCDWGADLTIRNKYPNEAKFKVNNSIRECKTRAFGLYAEGDITIESVELEIIVEKINNMVNNALVPSTIHSENDVNIKNSVAKLSGNLSHILSGDNITIDGGEVEIRNYRRPYYKRSKSIYAYYDIFVKNKAKLLLIDNYETHSEREINLDDYNDSYRILVEEVVQDPEPKEWDGITPLSNYAYIEIAPGTPTGEDIYLNKGLKKIDITIDEPIIGHSFPEYGQITSITPNYNIDDLDVEWIWYYNTEGYPGHGISSVNNLEKGFEEGLYYVILIYIPSKEGTLFDKESLKTPGNITVNGHNIDIEGLEFDSYSPYRPDSSEMGFKIKYCFGKTEYSYDFIQDTDNQTIYIDAVAETPITWVIDGDYTKFDKLLVDGTEFVKDVDYTVEEGSTKITLTDSGKGKLSALGVGDHTITANYTNDETATTNLTLTAKPVYTVTFDVNGHGTAPNKQSIEEGDKAENPGDLTDEEYIFVGWYEDATFNKLFDFENTSITSNITIYAKWEAVETDEDTSNSEAEDKAGSKGTSVNPKTGDNIYIWMGVLAISTLGIIITKKTSNKKE